MLWKMAYSASFPQVFHMVALFCCSLDNCYCQSELVETARILAYGNLVWSDRESDMVHPYGIEEFPDISAPFAVEERSEVSDPVLNAYADLLLDILYQPRYIFHVL